MSNPNDARRTLEETWRHLEASGREAPRDSEGRPFVPPQMPSFYDEETGFSYFKDGVEDADLSNLTLPRTYFGRSGLERVDFRNTDLSESSMCWNDFTGCDFRGADLSSCDMRASVFMSCKFDGANLTKADLRRSSFEGCSFRRANTSEAIADEVYAVEYGLWDSLTKKQRAAMTWHDHPGEEPDGG